MLRSICSKIGKAFDDRKMSPFMNKKANDVIIKVSNKINKPKIIIDYQSNKDAKIDNKLKDYLTNINSNIKF
jgi:hypothetical protein